MTDDQKSKGEPDMEVTEKQPHKQYYVNGFFVVTKRGLKAGIISGILGTIVSAIAFYVTHLFVEPIISEMPKTSAEWIKTTNDIHANVEPTIGKILTIGVIITFIGVTFLSQLDIRVRMEKAWKKYNVHSWDELTRILRQKGYKYPWWENLGFLEETK